MIAARPAITAGNNGMRLEDLNYFLAVAEAGNLGRAAQRLGLTQPALTKAVQRLEIDLGLQLFERTRMGMQLTTVGAAFFRRTREVGVAVEEAVREARDLHMGEVGIVRVGVVPPLADVLFSDACADLVRQRPAANVRVMINLNYELFSALALGDLDLVLSPLPEVRAADFTYEPLFDDELLVAAREDHPLLKRRGLRFADLAAAAWMLPEPHVGGREWIEQSFRERGLAAPKVSIENNSTVANLARVVRNTDLLTVIGGLMLRSPAGQGLAPVPLREAVWPRTVGMTTRRAAYLSPLVVRFLDIVRERAQVFVRTK
jgi:DNA-binding transcriptional LysR family regulator